MGSSCLCVLRLSPGWLFVAQKPPKALGRAMEATAQGSVSHWGSELHRARKGSVNPYRGPGHHPVTHARFAVFE